MRTFIYQRATEPETAVHLAGVAKTNGVERPAEYLAGGTTLLDLMKLNVVGPNVVVDINPLAAAGYGRIELSQNGLRLGALVRMAQAAGHPEIKTQYPVIAQSLSFAASQQIRNMASLGGNVLQRTRCTYFRDVSYTQCNKRSPGSGCAAISGVNRTLAVLGTSDQCIATYPGDFAQALIALDGAVELVGPDGTRTVPFSAVHRKPGGTPDRETNLRPNEMIASFLVPAAPWCRRSLYLKVRDRESYEFALASAAVALDQQNGAPKPLSLPPRATARTSSRSSLANAPWLAHCSKRLRSRSELEIPYGKCSRA